MENRCKVNMKVIVVASQQTDTTTTALSQHPLLPDIAIANAELRIWDRRVPGWNLIRGSGLCPRARHFIHIDAGDTMSIWR